jgi:hypothetical protein
MESTLLGLVEQIRKAPDARSGSLLHGKDRISVQKYAIPFLGHNTVNVPYHSSQRTRARAQRFDLQLPLRYRVCGEKYWLTGRIANISYTGVLFWTEQVIAVDDCVHISIEMPAELGGRGAEILCKGEIVRTVPPASSDSQPSLAAKIVAYRFVRARKSTN